MELQLAACGTVADVERVVAAAGGMGIGDVLAAIPECIDAGGLAQLVLRAGLADPAACIARAVAIDRQTGRVDWAVAWLAALGPRIAGLGRAQRSARVVERLVRAGADHTLADVVDLEPAELVAWLVECAGDLGPLDMADDAELSAAWNAWWSDHLLDAPAARARQLMRAHPAWFRNHVLLAAVYAVGAPCSDADTAGPALDALAASCGAGAEQSHVALPPRLLALIQQNPSVPALCRVLRDLADEDMAAAVAAGRQLAQAAWQLAQLGHAADVPTIVDVQGSAAAQQRLLARVTGAARQRRLPPLEVAAGLAELCRAGLFAMLDADAARGAWLQTLLRDGQIDGARQLLDGDATFASGDTARDAVCAAARELFDNAGDGDAVQAARRCLDVAPQHHSDDAVRRELLLVEAALLVRSLGGAGGGVLPLEIRLAPDAYDLVRLVLARHPGSHRKQRIIRQLAATARRIADPDVAPVPLRDLAVDSPTDALVLALMLEAANTAGDTDAAHRLVRQLAAARALLRRAMAAAEDHRAAQLLLPSAADDADRPLEARAVDCVWRACAAFGAAAHTAAQERQDALALALSLCPVGDIPMLLAQWCPVHRPAADDQSAADRVRTALLGAALQPTAASAQGSPGAALDPGAIRTFDPAVIRQCLSAHGPDARSGLLMEWLVFAQTAARGPTTDAALAFRARMEAEIVDSHGAAASHALAARVLPQLNPADHARLAAFYALYARCLADPAAKHQAGLRAQLAQHVAGIPMLCTAPLSALVALAIGDAKAACAELIDGDSIDMLLELAALAPELAQLEVLEPIDRPAPGPGRSEAQIASALYACQLQRHLEQADGAEPFADLLPEWVTLLERPDLADLAERVAFGPQAALGLAARHEAVDLCAALAGGSAVERARAFVEFTAALDAQRDPFSFAPLPRAWAVRLTDGVAADTDGDALASRLRAALCDMVAAAEPAYFVCQTFASAADLAAAWGAPLPGLADIYVEALSRAVSCDDSAADSVLAACESALQLCGFSYGDSQLGAVLGVFRGDFGAVLAQTAREGRVPGGPAVASAVRLALLRLHSEYCADTVAAESADLADQAAGASDLRLRLLADEHWGFPVPPAAEWLAVWHDLLRATRLDRAHVQIPALAALLADEGVDTPDCWAQLLMWPVRSACPQLVPRLVARLPPQHAAAVGPLLFDPLLADVPGQPQEVCALALLGLLFPDAAWADACMGPAVHAVLSAPTADRPPAEEPDAWDIDDVALDDGTPEDGGAVAAAVRDAIMDCGSLHLAIARGGYVSACAASMPLLARIGRTLLRAASGRPLGDDCCAVADGVSGGALELLRRTTTTLCDIGLERTALQWLYAFFAVPPTCRVAAARPAVLRWLRHLDALLCEPPPAPDSPLPPHEDEMLDGWGDDYDLDPELGAAKAIPDDGDGWGDDDIDLDADLENM
ncbi:hypothetical protein H4R19_001031 [Coemansia spiralis]|nr:hypothetical protein H4R19_001031 [Coemansia spiralis]